MSTFRSRVHSFNLSFLSMLPPLPPLFGLVIPVGGEDASVPAPPSAAAAC
jgi:hypothetical protein